MKLPPAQAQLREERERWEREHGSKKRSKYGNVPTEIDGYRFDSKKEADRYVKLRALEKQGAISTLRPHVSFYFDVNGSRLRYVDSDKSVHYEADFVYLKDGATIVEDVKSKPTMTRLYKIKKALMLACHGIVIREVM